MAKSTPLYVGLDVHKDSIAVAHATGASAAPPVFVGEIGTRQADLDKLIRRLQGKAPTLRFAYEAGPSGYGLYRYLTKKGLACDVVAACSPMRRPMPRPSAAGSTMKPACATCEPRPGWLGVMKQVPTTCPADRATNG